MSTRRTTHRGDADRLFVGSILEHSTFGALGKPHQAALRELTAGELAHLLQRLRSKAATGDRDDCRALEVVGGAIAALQAFELVSRVRSANAAPPLPGGKLE